MGSDISDPDTSGFAEAIANAEAADTVLFYGGLNQKLEGEFGDRPDFKLPAVQLDLLQQIYAVNQNVVLVLINGGAVTLEWADENLPAIVEAFYPGEEGGQAIADVLLGNYNPSGKLPVTFYKQDFEEQHDFFNMALRNGPGLTYRFFRGDPLYPFGHGLSYTTFDYAIGNAGQSVDATGLATFDVTVTNSGDVAGDVAALAFVKYLDQESATGDCPLQQLFDFKKTTLAAGESATLQFALTPGQALCVDTNGDYVVPPGRYEVTVGDATAQFVVEVEGRVAVLARTAIFVEGAPFDILDPSDPNNDDDEVLSTGAIAGIAVGSVAGVALVGAVVMRSGPKNGDTDKDEPLLQEAK
jgi:beta-glucosidase